MLIKEIGQVRKVYVENLDFLLHDYPRMSVNSILSMLPMNTVEKMAWIEIRNLGLPFLPQFPIGKYFADFADPVRRIVIEVDGKEWHSEDKDKVRDEFMQKLGYKIVRIPAYDVAEVPEYLGGEEVENDQFRNYLEKIYKENYL